MDEAMRLVLFFICSLAISHPLLAQTIQGRVISESGEALPGVKIWTDRAMSYGDPPQTDGSGRFSVTGSRTRLRFTLDGFKPTTVVLTPGQDVAVVLVKDENSVWRASACELTPATLEWVAMRFVLPKGAKLKDLTCSDACTAKITYKKGALWFGQGGNWSSGYPTASFFKDAKQITEREIQGGKNPFVEYRGTNYRGTYSRWIAMFGMTVTYDSVSKEEAAYFDKILDTLCWRPDFAEK
jgi:carboxypeptidase family protein